MTKGMDLERGERSFTVESSFPSNSPGGRYVHTDPSDAAKHAARIRFSRIKYSRNVLVLKLEETSRFTGTGLGPFYYRVTAIKKAPQNYTFDGISFQSHYDYKVVALTKEEKQKYENGNMKDLI